MRLLRSRTTPIGVDIGGRYIHAVQLEPRCDPPEISAALSIKRPRWGEAFDAEEAMRFASILDRHGLRGRRVNVAIPLGEQLTAVLELPPADSGAPLERISCVELAAAHKCEAESLESTFWTLPEPARPRSGLTVMAVGCRHDDANAMLDMLEGAGLDVVGLDVRSCAAARACAPILGHAGGLAGILDIDWSTSSLVVLAGATVVYERVIPTGGLCHVYEALLEELDLDRDVAEHVFRELSLDASDDADKPHRDLIAAARERLMAHLATLVPEVRVSLGYAVQEYGEEAVARISLLGEGATIPGLDAELSREFGVEVRPLGPDALAERGRVAAGTQLTPALTTAFGLALPFVRGGEG